MLYYNYSRKSTEATVGNLLKIVVKRPQRRDENMKKELCGFKRYLYTFNLNEKEKFEKMFNNAQKRGTVKQIFINNGYGFELQEWRIKM